MSEEAGGRRVRRNAGHNLWKDPRTGVYVWRRKHELTGKRFRKSTGTKILRFAQAKAQEFEQAHLRELSGLSDFSDYRRSLTMFLEPFFESVASEARCARLRAQLLRAFRLLRLERLADLEDFVAIERSLLSLEGTGPGKFSRKTLLKTFQVPLKQFSSYLASRREIRLDHLAAWKRLKVKMPPKRRRALLPSEVARILAAADCLDKMDCHAYPGRPVWTALLIAAPRISALAALDVVDLDRSRGRLVFEGNRIKQAGAGALDDSTLSEVIEYVGDRTEGPLFLTPEGKRIDGVNSLRRWRRAVSLAMVDLEWPEDQPRDLWLVYLVHFALLRGRVQAAMGGPKTGPNAPGAEKQARRANLADRVSRLAKEIRTAWQARMEGVDQHCLRMTHRTWALAAGVPEILIDRQLGHSSPAGDAALRAAWSAVGRAHYTDMKFLTLDARRSAEAVRGALGQAELEFQETVERGETALGARRGPGPSRAAGVPASKTGT